MDGSTSAAAPAAVGRSSGESVYVSAPDGLRLHVRHYGARTAPGLPVICLPGLARTSADFDRLATALASDTASPRRVIAVDYRGRGRSGYDRDPRNYSVTAELADLTAVLTALGIGPAVFIGTSRGGILTMLLAAAQPTWLAGAVLNDIGPVIEPKGLLRIKGYVGKLPHPRSFTEGGDILKRLFDAQFPKLTDDDWREAASLTWSERDGALVLNYDAKLARTLDGIDLERTGPPLWAQFDALAGIPLMLIRGALTDLLSVETAEAMRLRRPDLDYVEVPDEGHPPRIGTPELIAHIGRFIGRIERTQGA
jgi:pimeloyl-ACP methyl ester carboxylesterase